MKIRLPGKALLWLPPALAFLVFLLILPMLPASPRQPQVAPFDDRGLHGDNFQFSPSETVYLREMYQLYLHDTAARMNIPELTGMSDDGFACFIAAKILREDASIYSDDQPVGVLREIATLPPSLAGHDVRIWAEKSFYQEEISWGPANMAYPNVKISLLWWRKRAASLGRHVTDLRTAYYVTGRGYDFNAWLAGSNREMTLFWEMQTGQGTTEMTALVTLRAADRARRYYASIGEPEHPLSAYAIALGIEAYDYPSERLYELRYWTSKGYYYDWINTMDSTARMLGLPLKIPEDYLPFTEEEEARLEALPRG